MQIYPAILTDDSAEAQQQLDRCQENSEIETVQIDCIDGFFADELTIDIGALLDLDFGSLTADLHLMTQEPIDAVRELAEYGTGLPIRTVIAQIEQMGSQSDYVALVKRNNWKVGLSLNIFTPLDQIEHEIWHELDCIQLMAIEAGTQGQTLRPLVFEKLTQLYEYIEKHDLQLEVIVDGGVKKDTIVELAAHGVEGVAVGSALWRAEDFDLAYQELLLSAGE